MLNKPAAKNFFITIEGIEGTGKSTAIAFIRRQLEMAHIPHSVTREPGGTEIADAIRRLLLAHYQEPMDMDTELLLMFASRAQNLAQVIKPALAEGKWVLCDRFTDASYAYQGGGRGVPKQRIATLENWVHADLQPDLVILLDAPVATGLARIEERKTKDRIEREKAQFFERVRAAYLERAQQNPQRYKIIDANRPVAEVEQQLVRTLEPYLATCRIDQQHE